MGGKKALHVLWPGLRDWEGFGCQISSFGPWRLISPGYPSSVSPGLAGDLPFVAAAVGGSRSPTKPIIVGQREGRKCNQDWEASSLCYRHSGYTAS